MNQYRLHEEIYENNDGSKTSRIYRYNDGILTREIGMSGDFNMEIEEIKYSYDQDGNIKYIEQYENNVLRRTFEYKFNKNILEKIIVYRNKNLYEYYTMFYENGKKTKQCIFSSSDSLKYELKFKYDDSGKRTLTLKDNEFHCMREYDHMDLLHKIHLKSGRYVYYIWEQGQTTYDYDMLFGC